MQKKQEGKKKVMTEHNLSIEGHGEDKRSIKKMIYKNS